jgi:hypothetical protein
MIVIRIFLDYMIKNRRKIHENKVEIVHLYVTKYKINEETKVCNRSNKIY